nr:hypothetical protein [Streptomyces aureocirculatus]
MSRAVFSGVSRRVNSGWAAAHRLLNSAWCSYSALLRSFCVAVSGGSDQGFSSQMGFSL